MTTFYTAKDLADSMRTVRKNTIVIAEEIPEDRYGFRWAEGVRSIGELLVHIAVVPRMQHQLHAIDRLSSLANFDFFSVVQKLHAEEKVPRSKAEIIDLLKQEGESNVNWIAELTPEFLAERVEMPQGMTPATKSRFEMLLSNKEHEMHHRGQLMVIERLIGITPHLTRQMQAMMQQYLDRQQATTT